jgi:catechol 2,3-dioxygenase-like lactoylglutathione lyase family enzyme
MNEGRQGTPTLRSLIPLLGASVCTTPFECANQMQVVQQSKRHHTSVHTRFGHVALAVCDIDNSSKWYRRTLGVVEVSPVYDVVADSSPLGRVATALFGPNIRRLRILQLATPDGVGIELFQLVDPAPANREGAPANGIIHFAFITATFDATVARLNEAGATLIVANDADPKRRVAFFSDLDGNTIEIASSAWAGIPLR